MQTHPQYTITSRICESERQGLYRAVRDSDGLPVVLKMTSRHARPRDVERLRAEFELGRGLTVPSVVRPIAFDDRGEGATLVLEAFDGQPLDTLLGQPMPIGRFLELAIAITAGVRELHREGILHKDLKPSNILVRPGSAEIRIIDLGIASRAPREHGAHGPRLVEGSLPYLSPEQTGRMNRAVDSRSDLYALGVTFFQMLTARLPFHATDPLGWVHCHIARPPPSPSELVPSIPRIVSDIVLRLLAKVAEERYQSAAGLLADLECASEALRETGTIAPFALGKRDVSERFVVPQKLYGRTEEVAALVRAFDEVAAGGAPVLLLISGYSGIGKSALVHELGKPVVRERGAFVAGKFDQYKRDIPYAPIVHAVRELVLEVLADSEERVAVWRERFKEALGTNGRLLVDLIPEIGGVIGPQPPVVELPAGEARIRFHQVFRSFLRTFARHDHPLALFLDDLQWADGASLDLIVELATDPDTRSLLLVGAYRDNEVSPSHPLTAAIDGLRRQGAAVREIVLGPLGPRDVCQLVADTTRCDEREAAALGELVHAKTGGNPFFANQFLTMLHAEGLLELDERGAWRADLERIRGKGYTDNVVDLMVHKLRRLAPATQGALRRAACAGARVELSILAAISERTEAEIEELLREAVAEGLVVRAGDAYAFVHDRVQQAAYSLIPEAERAAAHLRIGRLLLASTPPDRRDERVFDLVAQLGRGAHLLTDPAERRCVAELHLGAGAKARASAAHASAAKILRTGASLLAQDCWATDHDLAFRIHFELAQCEFLAGRFDEAGALFGELKARARTKAARADVCRVEVDALVTKGDIAAAVETALEGLRPFGIDMSPHPSFDEVRAMHERIVRRLDGRRIEDLIDLPEMTDLDMQAAMRLLSVLYGPAFFTDNNLLFLHLAHMVDISLRFGNTAASAHGYGWYGAFTLTIGFRRYDDGYRFGKLGYDLMVRGGHTAYEASASMVMEMVSFWTRPIDEMVDYVRASFRAAAGSGDRPLAGYACNHLVIDLLERGDHLEEVFRESEARMDYVRRANYQDICDILVSIQRYIRAMQGLTRDLSTFDGPGFDERAFEATLVEGRMTTLVCWHYLMKMMGRFMAGEYAEALVAGERCWSLAWASRGLVQIHDIHFYYLLTLAALDHETGGDERAHRRELMAKLHAQLGEWKDNCAHNFMPSYALATAEIARTEGRVDDACRWYEQAIRAAREGRFVQTEALAHELAAKFWRARGLELAADAHAAEARALYVRWGADGKAAQLDRLFPRLAPHGGALPTSTLAMRAEQLDVLSVVTASQAISREIEHERLACTLLRVILEQGGGQRAYLRLERDGSSIVEGEAVVAGATVESRIVSSRPASDPPLVPRSLVDYVRRTRQRVILEDATRPHRFSSDPYFTRRSPRSVLCLPLLRQGVLIGFEYLENDLLAGAFTPDRLAVLELVSSQAAISLEHAAFLQREHAARDAAEAAERRAAFLDKASVLLTESLEHAEALRRLSRLCVDFLADWCVIDLTDPADPAAPLRRAAGAHSDPAKEPLVAEVTHRYAPRWLGPQPSVQVLRTREPLLVPDMGDDELGRNCVDDEHMALVRQLGTRSVLSVPLLARGRVLGAITLCSGTPGRYGEADLELARDLAHRAAISIENARLYEDLQQAVRLREEFLSIASHELNTPMTSLMLSLDALRPASPSRPSLGAEGTTRLLDMVHRQGERLRRLISDLLDVARIDGGRLALERTAFDLGALVRDVVARSQPELERAGCAVSLPDDSEKVVGVWDRSRLDQVLTNLLSNARKFGASAPIEIRIARGHDAVTLSVQDHGMGIAPERRSKLFERFERGVSVDHYGGLGLGLYICRALVEAHGGKIRAESALGVGSTFAIELPLDVSSRMAEPAGSS